jgi:hypothetical protein
MHSDEHTFVSFNFMSKFAHKKCLLWVSSSSAIRICFFFSSLSLIKVQGIKMSTTTTKIMFSMRKIKFRNTFSKIQNSHLDCFCFYYFSMYYTIRSWQVKHNYVAIWISDLNFVKHRKQHSSILILVKFW